MPIPGKRRSRSKKRRGWAHLALSPLTLTTCPACGKRTPPHQACQFCGQYRGRKVMVMQHVKTAAQSKEKHEHKHQQEEKAAS